MIGDRRPLRASIGALVALVALAGCAGAIERDELAAEVRARGGGLVADEPSPA